MRVLTIVLVLVGATVNAQEPRPARFAGNPERLATAFTSVDALQELRDGRVVVVDAAERSISIGDFAKQLVTPVSRHGSGPAEYLQPRQVFGLADGGVLVADPANARFLRLSPEGRVLGPWQVASPRGQRPAMTTLLAAWDARAMDGRSRLYYDVTPGPLQPGQSAIVPIVRIDLETNALDTVARYVLSADMQTMVPTPGGRGVTIVRRRAWPSRTEWSVAPNGTVVVVTPAPYRVSSITNGRQHEGPPVTVQPVRVTDADRSNFVAFVADLRRRPSGPSSPEPPRPAGASAPPQKRGGAPIFPEVMPPFSGRDAVQVAPDGRIWVSRLGNVTDTIQVVDVFWADGRLEDRMALPPRRRPLSLSEKHVYLVFRDANDLEYVERYARPRR